MADQAIVGLWILLLARAEGARFAVSGKFEAESTNARWLGFKSYGLSRKRGKRAGCELEQRFSGAFVTGGLAVFHDNRRCTFGNVADR